MTTVIIVIVIYHFWLTLRLASQSFTEGASPFYTPALAYPWPDWGRRKGIIRMMCFVDTTRFRSIIQTSENRINLNNWEPFSLAGVWCWARGDHELAQGEGRQGTWRKEQKEYVFPTRSGPEVLLFKILFDGKQEPRNPNISWPAIWTKIDQN